MTSFAVVVHTCDRYQLLYRGFAHFFAAYWPPGYDAINYYFLTEEMPYAPDGFVNLRTGPGAWADRLRRGLAQIPETHVLYFQEDMWLTRPVAATTLNAVLDFAATHPVELLKLHSSEVYRTQPTDTVLDGLRLATLDNRASHFLMSHQVTLWDKQLLTSQLRPGEHPWRNERRATRRLRRLAPLIYHLDLFAENGKPALNQNPDPSHRSEYFTVSVNATLNEYAGRFVDSLRQTADPALLAYADQLAHHAAHQLTHDGLPRPRREDGFKRLRRWLTGR